MKWMIHLFLFYVLNGYADGVERGQVYFFQYCAGCHSLEYAKADLFKKPVAGTTLWIRQTLKGHWISALNSEDAEHWFGRVPPDLSLITQQFSKRYVVDYLLGFYNDSTHPLGRNNHLVSNVLMPDVLSSPCKTHLCLSKSLKNAKMERAQIADDIAEFLAYVAAPQEQQHRRVGTAVMMLCLFAMVLAWFLKKNY